MTENTKKTRLIAAAAVIAAFALGAALSALVVVSLTQHDTSTDKTSDVPTLSGEAYTGCIALGMGDESIREDPDACLLAYWTPDRLSRIFDVQIAWREYQGLPTGCDEDGVCRLDGGDSDTLPGEGHPFWEEQALLKLDRVSPPTDISR